MDKFMSTDRHLPPLTGLQNGGNSGLTGRLPSVARVHFSAMPRTKRVSSRGRLLLKTRPKRGALVRDGDRIAEGLGEARGERGMIRSLHADGVERRSAVKWKNLRLLDDQLI